MRCTCVVANQERSRRSRRAAAPPLAPIVRRPEAPDPSGRVGPGLFSIPAPRNRGERAFVRLCAPSSLLLLLVFVTSTRPPPRPSVAPVHRHIERTHTHPVCNASSPSASHSPPVCGRDESRSSTARVSTASISPREVTVHIQGTHKGCASPCVVVDRKHTPE